MAIFVDENTKVVYQGLTGSNGRFYGLRNREYGTQVVAGTNPKKAGTDVEGIPVYASVGEAVAETGADTSCIFIPAPGVEAAVHEAAEGGVKLIVVITEGVPAQDEARFFNVLKRDHPDVQLLGPNCPGIISPGKCNIGITAGEIAMGGGPVGIVSRSGTLTYQALHELTQKGIGQTTCVGIGGDPVPGTSFIDCLERFEADPETKAVMMIGEIGGSAEEEAAEFIAETMTKPVVSYIAGVTAPPGKKMGHAGAIVSRGKGTAEAKMDALRKAGAEVGENPTEAGELMAERRRRPLAGRATAPPPGGDGAVVRSSAQKVCGGPAAGGAASSPSCLIRKPPIDERRCRRRDTGRSQMASRPRPSRSSTDQLQPMSSCGHHDRGEEGARRPRRPSRAPAARHGGSFRRDDRRHDGASAEQAGRGSPRERRSATGCRSG